MIDDDRVVKACLKRISLVWIFVSLCIFAGVVTAGEMPPDHLTVEIANITYRNNEEYRVEITLGNRSGGSLDPERFEVSFSAQSEVLGQWIELDCRSADGPGKGTLPGGNTLIITEIVSIPLSIPHLFRNHEGDVNLRFRYKLISASRGSTDASKYREESAYWLTPRTDRWVLREGM
jgi:hypothetical protein